jgi:hypothetical protein
MQDFVVHSNAFETNDANFRRANLSFYNIF